jgi:F-type H+-transporting ATPase subunit b
MQKRRDFKKMNILGQLGINSTAAIQFILFAISILFLTKAIFSPYLSALEERKKRTKGGEDLALEILAQSKHLQKEYETKLRGLNDQIKSTVESAKTLADKDYREALSSAKAEAELFIANNRKELSGSIEVAASELKSQTTAVAMAITTKLIK